MRKLVDTIFISNNRQLFNLWSKDLLAKRRKGSKYYENDCLLNFRLLFMCLLIPQIVVMSHILARIYFII